MTKDSDPEKAKAESLDELIESASQKLAAYDFEQVIKELNSVFNNSFLNDDQLGKALQMRSEAFLEMSLFDHAKNDLVRLFELEIASPSQKIYAALSLSQLHNGEESLEFYNKALFFISRNDVEYRDELIASVWTSVAELYMTDLCEENDAESKCREAISLALSSVPMHFDANRVAAEFSIIVGKIEDAKLYVSKLENYEQASYDSVTGLVKLYIELEMYIDALQVVDYLIQLDDEVLEVWYLAALSSQLAGLKDDCNEAVNHGINLASRMRLTTDYVDEELVEALKIISMNLVKN